ncbi:MAG TPA: hypothetical protein PLK55_04365 [archaeon]|nr:hypothetical protein [archaeon]
MAIDYKKLDKTILLFCPSIIILMIIVGILSSTMGAPISRFPIISAIFIFLGTFSAVYLIWSFCFWIIGLISKKTNYKFNFIIKSATSIVLAILIVYILSIPLCGDNCGGRNTSPTTNAKTLLGTQVNNPGAESCTESVVFTKQNSQLSAEGITQNTGLDPEQVIFSNPQDISNFQASNSLLKYTGTANKRVIMCIVCSEGKTNLERALIDNEINVTVNSTIEGQTLCIVYPRKTA